MSGSAQNPEWLARRGCERTWSRPDPANLGHVPIQRILSRSRSILPGIVGTTGLGVASLPAAETLTAELGWLRGPSVAGTISAFLPKQTWRRMPGFERC